MSIIDDIKGTQVTFVTNGKKKTLDLAGIFEIDETDLSKEFTHQAAL